MISVCFRKPKEVEPIKTINGRQMLEMIQSEYPSLKIDHSARIHLGHAMKELGYEHTDRCRVAYYKVVPLKVAWGFYEVSMRFVWGVANTSYTQKPITIGSHRFFLWGCEVFLAFFGVWHNNRIVRQHPVFGLRCLHGSSAISLIKEKALRQFSWQVASNPGLRIEHWALVFVCIYKKMAKLLTSRVVEAYRLGRYDNTEWS